MKNFAFSMLLLASISYTGIACSSSDEETTDNGTESTDTGESEDDLPDELPVESELLAFPTAEGYGKNTVGGRGGKIYEVTNLNDSGEGSLREAVEAKGPRTVVFKVSGTIALKSKLAIRNPYITIAGQTAPGDGICLKDHYIEIMADEVIIRYIRVRLGDESNVEGDCISARGVKNLILDHVSSTWSTDECMSIYHCENITVQWCLIGESLFQSVHTKGYHGFGGIWGSNYGTYHHNLLAHNSSRNPRISSGCGYTDYRNNVIYNWGYNSCYGGDGIQDDSADEFNFSEINMVANYYKPGPATEPGSVSYRIANPSVGELDGDFGYWYVADNYMEGNSSEAKNVCANNWSGGVQISGGDAATKMKMHKTSPWTAMAIDQQTAAEAYKLVLDNAGAVLPKRDAVDTRIVNDARTGTATYEGVYKTQKKVADDSKICGIIDSQTQVGGWPELKTENVPVDSDHDGMPDVWENKYNLNPNDASDANKVFKDGYTYLEKYLNSLCK